MNIFLNSVDQYFIFVFKFANIKRSGERVDNEKNGGKYFYKLSVQIEVTPI